jgi:hypothetical protein
MSRFRHRFASAFVPHPETMAERVALQVARWVLVPAAFLFVLGCAYDVPSQQMSAYSTATGFLTLCDDSDFDHALEHFAKPLKSSPTGGTWVKEMQDHRAGYGIPVIRSLVSRDTQEIRGSANDVAKVNFVFRTSFLGTTPGEEYVSVEKFNGKWQVYDYKFRPSGKPGALKKADIKKDWEDQSDE